MAKFVVIEHKAIKAGLHYDLRFEIPKSNKWASFAVRKGVPLSPGKKVLAVKTKDHSRKEALFTGTIKAGEYGAGNLKKWDSGSCIILKYSSTSMTIDFKGSKVKGIYHFVSTGVIDKDFKKPTYMLFKSSKLAEVLRLKEDSNDSGGSCGMASRVPPGDTQEIELEKSVLSIDEMNVLPVDDLDAFYDTVLDTLDDVKLFKKKIESLTSKDTLFLELYTQLDKLHTALVQYMDRMGQLEVRLLQSA